VDPTLESGAGKVQDACPDGVGWRRHGWHISADGDGQIMEPAEL